MYYAQHRPKGKIPKKWIALFSSLILILIFSAGITLAFLSMQTQPKENVFQPSKVACQVTETFTDNIKTDVAIKNIGNTQAYIRTAVVATWVDAEGQVSAEAPVEGTDYELTYLTDKGWIEEQDGYWYYQTPVAPDASTDILIESCKQLQEKDGYQLFVEILAEAIQSEPSQAAVEAWSVTISQDGAIIGKGA